MDMDEEDVSCDIYVEMQQEKRPRCQSPVSEGLESSQDPFTVKADRQGYTVQLQLPVKSLLQDSVDLQAEGTTYFQMADSQEDAKMREAECTSDEVNIETETDPAPCQDHAEPWQGKLGKMSVKPTEREFAERGTGPPQTCPGMLPEDTLLSPSEKPIDPAQPLLPAEDGSPRLEGRQGSNPDDAPPPRLLSVASVHLAPVSPGLRDGTAPQTQSQVKSVAGSRVSLFKEAPASPPVRKSLSVDSSEIPVSGTDDSGLPTPSTELDSKSMEEESTQEAKRETFRSDVVYLNIAPVGVSRASGLSLEGAVGPGDAGVPPPCEQTASNEEDLSQSCLVQGRCASRVCV